jgi:O-antigen/teichoic acid export membrane protein
MIDKILRLGKETAIYGLSTVLGRLLNFLIVPLYANLLLPAENGVVANLYAYIAFAFVLFCYGMEAAYMRFVSSLESGDKRQNFTVPFLSLAVTSVAFALLIHSGAGTIAAWVGVRPEHERLIRYAGWILCFDTLAVIPFASLRMDRKARVFAGLKLLNIGTNLLLNVLFLVVLRMNAEGILLANLIASVLTVTAMLGIIVRNLRFSFPQGLYGQILRFGLPYVPAGLAGIAMQVIDRPIVRYLTNDATLGIYQLNYRLGIFMMLIVGMFDYAWRPFFLTHAKEPDAKPLFARVFTYFTLGMMTIFLLVSLFIDDIVRIHLFGRQFFPPAYWVGTFIVPWVLLAYVFTGAYVVFMVGVYLEKKTKYLPLISGLGAAINVAVNFLLIPRLGILGAALATLASYIVMAGGMYIVSQRFYRVPYEWGKVFRACAAAGVLFVAVRLIGPAPLSLSGLGLKSVAVVVFVISVWLLRVVDRTEVRDTVAAIGRLFGRPGTTVPTEAETEN